MRYKVLLALLVLAACQPDPPDRADLLTRLQAALPQNEDGGNSANVRTGFAEFEAQMAVVNPGRDTEIASVLNDYADCINQGMREVAPTLAVAAADSSLSNAEIEQLIEFYSGPERERFAALEAQERAGAALGDADATFLARHRNSQAARQFAAAMAETARNFPATDTGRRMIGACTLRMRSAFGRAEMIMP